MARWRTRLLLYFSSRSAPPLGSSVVPQVSRPRCREHESFRGDVVNGPSARRNSLGSTLVRPHHCATVLCERRLRAHRPRSLSVAVPRQAAVTRWSHTHTTRMADSSVQRAANSAPSGRNYQAEKDALLAQAQALRDEAEAIDLVAATKECLERGSTHFANASECAEQNAARATEKVRLRRFESASRKATAADLARGCSLLDGALSSNSPHRCGRYLSSRSASRRASSSTALTSTQRWSSLAALTAAPANGARPPRTRTSTQP